jgi:Nif-specific regulatory protein
MAKSHLGPELLAIYEISKILSSPFDLRKGLRESLSVLSSFLYMRHGVVVLKNDDGGLRAVAAPELHHKECDDLLRSRFAFIQQVMKGGAPAVLPMGNTVLLAVPIQNDHKTLGMLGIERYEEETAQSRYASDIQVLKMVANLMGSAIQAAAIIEAERAEHAREKEMLKAELSRKYSIDNVIGQSKAMQEVFAQVHLAAKSKSTVLLRGESGTGKEAIAKAIHFLSPRKKGPFIKLNCAALPDSLLESELFGHEKGAFTGAAHERKGRFELAHGGTLFLDEIGDTSPAFQTKLLRVLQEHEFERLGGTKTIKTDFRLVAATNRNLEEAVAKGEFRADLYYRINVVSIFLPPLRERREDIPLLVEHFLDQYNKENQRELKVAPETLQMMLHCYWPGNVRELENCVERTATMTTGEVIKASHLLCSKRQCFSAELWQQQTHLVEDNQPVKPTAPAADEMPSEGREKLLWALENAGWVQAKAARILGLTPRQIAYAIKKHGIAIKKI